MGLSQLSGNALETVTIDINFVASAFEDRLISLGRRIKEVVRGRLYIYETPPGAAFSAWATYTFYSKAAKLGEDAFYRTAAKLVYTELEDATPGGAKSIKPDDHTDFTPNDLVRILDAGGDEYARLAVVADTMISEDNVGAHDINDGLVRVSEFSGLFLFNDEAGTNVYMRVGFALAQTVSLRMELVLRK